MELEKLFTKCYKRICLNPTNEQLTSRIEGINVAKKDYDSPEEIVELLKIYYKEFVNKKHHLAKLSRLKVCQTQTQSQREPIPLAVFY